MKHYTSVIINSGGIPVAGANVQVNLAGTSTPATVYLGDGVNPITQPVVADANGRVSFYVADGRYDLLISSGSFSTVESDIEIADISEANAPDVPWVSEGIQFVNQSVPPATPPAGKIQVFSKTDRNLYKIDESGSVSVVGGGVSLGFDVTQFGAVADVQVVTDASGNSSNNQVTSATANFKAGDVGKLCYLIQGNNFNLFSAATILSVQSSTVCTVSATIPGGGTYPGTFVWGTDNSTAFANATAAALAVASSFILPYVYIPQGNYIVNANPVINGSSGKISVRGAGKLNTNLFISPNFPFSNTGGGNVITGVIEVADLSIRMGTGCNLSLGNIILINCAIFRRCSVKDWNPTSGGNNVVLQMLSDDAISEDFDINTSAVGMEIASLHHVMHRGEIMSNGDIALIAADTANHQIVSSLIAGHIGIQDGPNNGLSNWHFVNCKISGGSASGINLITNGSVLRLENCFVEGSPAITIGSGVSNTLTAASNASGGYTTYTGTFSTPFGPNGDINNMLVTIAGYTNAGNNGTFPAVSCNGTTLIVANPNGVAETHAGTATWQQTIYAGNCDIANNGTGSNCINNSGVFVDLGGNIFSGTFTGSGVYQGPIFASAIAGFGNGASGTAVTTTTKSTGTGPATPQTVVKYISVQLPVNGSYQTFWIPLMQ